MKHSNYDSMATRVCYWRERKTLGKRLHLPRCSLDGVGKGAVEGAERGVEFPIRSLDGATGQVALPAHPRRPTSSPSFISTRAATPKRHQPMAKPSKN